MPTKYNVLYCVLFYFDVGKRSFTIKRSLCIFYVGIGTYQSGSGGEVMLTRFLLRPLIKWKKRVPTNQVLTIPTPNQLILGIGTSCHKIPQNMHIL